MHMKSLFIRSAALALCASALPAQAAIIFNNVARQDFTTNRGIGDSPLAIINVSAATTINQIGAYVDLASAGNLKFLIYNATTNALLFSTGPVAFADDGLAFKLSPIFTGFTLNAGVTYGIGAIADVAGLWGTNNTSSGNPFTQGGITSSDDRNLNVGNYASPTLGSDGAAMIIVQLGGGRKAGR
jgi:hypothetical protein